MKDAAVWSASFADRSQRGIFDSWKTPPRGGTRSQRGHCGQSARRDLVRCRESAGGSGERAGRGNCGDVTRHILPPARHGRRGSSPLGRAARLNTILARRVPARQSLALIVCARRPHLRPSTTVRLPPAGRHRDARPGDTETPGRETQRPDLSPSAVLTSISPRYRTHYLPPTRFRTTLNHLPVAHSTHQTANGVRLWSDGLSP